MPSALAITRSSGVVMKPRTRSALAPTYTVVTCTTAMSLRGYWRTLSERMACKPGNQDHQVDDNREDRSLDEKICELH